VALGLQFALDEALFLGFGGLLEAFMSLLGELQLATQPGFSFLSRLSVRGFP